MKTFMEPLNSKEEAELLISLKNGDKVARNTLIERNLRLVAHIAKKYHSSEKDFDDILSIGTIGLIKAVNTFDVDKGNKLVTYASKCIENEILMYLRSEKKHGREVSLHEPLGTDKDGNTISFLDVLECDSRDLIAEYSDNEQIKWLLKNIDKILSPLEFVIIKKRYGLFGETPLTQREIAKSLSISRSYVSRIEKKSLAKLKSQIELAP